MYANGARLENIYPHNGICYEVRHQLLGRTRLGAILGVLIHTSSVEISAARGAVFAQDY